MMHNIFLKTEKRSYFVFVLTCATLKTLAVPNWNLNENVPQHHTNSDTIFVKTYQEVTVPIQGPGLSL